MRYDNERGKGDHRHAGGVETNYEFTDLDTLLADFERDVTKGGTSNESHHRSWRQRDRIQGRAGTTRAEGTWPGPGLTPVLRVGTDAVCRADSRLSMRHNWA